MSTPTINNPFTPQTITIDVSGNSYQIADVSGNFYDMKNHIEFDVNMEVDPLYKLDSFVVDIDHADATTRDNHFTHTLTNVPRIVNGYNVSKTISLTGTGCGNIEYNFVNHQEYKIQYIAIFRLKSGSATSASLYKTSHIQLFTYYASPVTLVSDFAVSENVSSGDSIEVTGLILDLSGNEIDETRPEYLTFSFQEYDNEVGDTNNFEEYDEPYIVRQPYDPSGNYTLTNNTLSNGSSYEMLVTAQWALGYNSARISEQTIVVFNSPSIPEDGIVVLPLYLRNTNDNVITINLSPADEGEIEPSKVWFQFKTTGGSSTVVATAGGVGGVVYNPSANSYSFRLNQLVPDVSGVYLENDVSYNVVVKGEYNNIIVDASGASIPVYGYSAPRSVTFDLTEPTISDIAVNSLYLRDVTEKIATITVDHEAYELYAPYATDGIKFVFYDSNDNEVARTNAYTFANASGNGVSSYDIKLSEVNYTSGYLENDITYTVRAAVKVTDHEGTTSYRVSSESYNVIFALTEPTISNIVVNYLCLVDPSGNILPSDDIATITVDHEAYELVAPHATDGIKFVFYDGATEVARTNAYPFANTSSGSTEYDIKLSEVNYTSGYLENDVTYTVKAAVKVTDHEGNTSYNVSSESYNVTFDLTEPTISNIVVNSLYLVDPSGNILPSPNIATITVNHEAYELVAPHATDGIKFVFYDGSTEVARTSAYTFVNSASGVTPYNIKLSEVNSTSGYLENDITYTVKAAVKVTNHEGNTDYIVSSESYDVTFDLTRPVIGSIVAYDVQNDGGQDGVFHPDSTDVDSDSQIVATISVDTATYELYAPNQTNGILFIFYNASGVEVARTSEYTFENDSSSSSNLYNIHLDDISGNTLLTNGTTYKVKTQVKLIDHSGTEELRLSAEFYNDVIFTQNLAPVPYVEISNTWALVTNNDPESYRTNFANSPYIGISGNFSKNAQFGSLYYKHLDTTSTKFKLEYKVSDMSGTLVTDWTTVKKAKLVLQGISNSTESLTVAAERARSTAGTLSTVSSGEYANIPGTGLGTDQGDIVFYIPQKQVGTVNAFTEYHIVEVRVRVVDSSSPSLWGGLTTSEPTASDPLQVILKIDEYNFTNDSESEPWNSVDASNNLLINIPILWNSIHSYSVKVDYKYDVSGNYGTEVEFLRADHPGFIHFIVDPTLGTTLYYRVRYVVTNTNLDAPATTTDGILTAKNVPNKFFPESSDYSILNAEYATFNADASSSITFDLSFNIDPANRLDGVNVYFTSTDSNIDKVRIGSYTTAGSKTITLIDVTDVSGVHLEIMDPSGNIVTSAFSWDKYDSAAISFEAFRDARVNSTTAFFDSVSTASAPEESEFYVESGSKSTFGSPDVNPIWNVPVLTAPSEDGDITLSGGVINMIESADNHYIQWTMTDVNDDPTRQYTYDLKMTNNTTSEVIHNTLNFTDPSGIYILDIDNASVLDVAKYTVELTKVFNGTTTSPERSPVDTIVFHTIYVDTSNIDITVRPVSNTTVVNLSWDELDISGNSVTASGQELSSFANNIYAHYITYRTDPSDNLVRLDQSGNLIEQIDAPATKKTYTLPVQDIGTLYEFFMYVEAQVKYTINGAVSSTKSTPFEVPTTLTTSLSQYRVSSVPSFGVVTTDSSDNDVNIVPVLVQNSSTPTLLMNLNANGLEDEGFISVVVILTQDGTDDKPEGEQVVLIFPDTGSTFSFDQVIVGGAAGNTDPRLGGGDSATSVPRNVDYTVLSTDPSNNDYTLTIGTVGSDGRFGLSTLEMPSTINSDFVDGSIVNYMVILTTRRGTDIGVGEFIYEAIPSVQNVEIVTVDGQYFVNFDIVPA